MLIQQSIPAVLPSIPKTPLAGTAKAETPALQISHSAQLMDQQQERLEKLSEAEKALSDLSQNGADPNEMKRALAAQKVEMLKQLVKVMQQLVSLASGDDAKALLTRLKSIAGQLKQAVAQYAAAGGSGGGGSSAAGAGSISLNTTSSEGDTASAAESGVAVEAATDAAASRSATETDSAQQSETQEEGTDVQTATVNITQPARPQRDESSKVDQEFKDTVHKLLTNIKALAERAKQTLQREDNKEARELMKELKTIEKTLQKMEAGETSGTNTGTALSAINPASETTVSAAYSASPTTGTISNISVNLASPAVNISA